MADDDTIKIGMRFTIEEGLLVRELGIVTDEGFERIGDPWAVGWAREGPKLYELDELQDHEQLVVAMRQVFEAPLDPDRASRLHRLVERFGLEAKEDWRRIARIWQTAKRVSDATKDLQDAVKLIGLQGAWQRSDKT